MDVAWARFFVVGGIVIALVGLFCFVHAAGGDKPKRTAPIWLIVGLLLFIVFEIAGCYIVATGFGRATDG